MIHASLRPHVLMGSLIAVLLVIANVAGLFVQDIYAAFLPPHLVAAQFVQDSFSLLAAPALVIAMWQATRGSVRALMLWAGLLLYVGYYYCFYAFDHVMTPYYPVYLALLGLSIYSLVGLLSGVDQTALMARVEPTMPVRFISVIMGSTLLFVPLWLINMARDIAAQRAAETATVYVLDLSFLIPALTYAAVQLWRRRPVGYLLTGALVFKAPISGLLLAIMTLRHAWLGGPLVWEELVMYLFLATVGMAGLFAYLRHLRANAPAARAATPSALRTQPR